ncbi:MAG TPA: ANTAR domain-containing protein [Trebonia sp.]|jgi:AmiR/NasT family two-component response regulator
MADEAKTAMIELQRELEECYELTGQLHESLASRAVIDQALGVIMATEHCAHNQALHLLRLASQNSNVKLRDLAATIVTGVSGEPPRPGTPFGAS